MFTVLRSTYRTALIIRTVKHNYYYCRLAECNSLVPSCRPLPFLRTFRTRGMRTRPKIRQTGILSSLVPRRSGKVSRFSWHCEIFRGLPIRLQLRTCHAIVTKFKVHRYRPVQSTIHTDLSTTQHTRTRGTI